MNRLGLEGWPAPQPQHTLFHIQKGFYCRTQTYIQPLTRRNALPVCQGEAWGIYGSNPIEYAVVIETSQ